MIECIKNINFIHDFIAKFNHLDHYKKGVTRNLRFKKVQPADWFKKALSGKVARDCWFGARKLKKEPT